MDLTKTAPRSSRELFGGIVGLGRTTDKARAFNAATLGDYHYGECPHDSAILGFLHIDPHAYARLVGELVSDERIEAHARSVVERFSPNDVERFNDRFLHVGPGSSMPELPIGHPLRDIDAATFEEFRVRIAPDRPDIATFVDLLDYEDGRVVAVA